MLNKSMLEAFLNTHEMEYSYDKEYGHNEIQIPINEKTIKPGADCDGGGLLVFSFDKENNFNCVSFYQDF